MNEKYKLMEQIVERFFEGETSAAEERELYEFFSGIDVPEHLEGYIPVFRYFDNEMAENLKTSEFRFSQKSKRWRRKRRIAWTAVAASLLMFVGISFVYDTAGEDDDAFEGSYIVRNGVKITDLKLIRPELEKMLQTVSAQHEKYEQMIRQINEPEDFSEQIVKNIEDQYEKLREKLLNQFENETIRNEVKKILNL